MSPALRSLAARARALTAACTLLLLLPSALAARTSSAQGSRPDSLVAARHASPAGMHADEGRADSLAAAQLEDARALLRDDQEAATQRAVRVLDSLTTAHPAFVHDDLGAAALWLGRAYARLGKPSAALSAWTRGVRALTERASRSAASSADAAYASSRPGSPRGDGARALVEARLADAFLTSLDPSTFGPRRRLAAAAYLDLLRHADPEVLARLAPEAQAAVRRHVRLMATLLPPGTRQHVFALDDDEAEAGVVPEGASVQPRAHEVLLRWWRLEDPFPSTAANERLYEHLERLTYARTHFACPSDPHGVDARGRLHVRLGAPSRRRELDYYADGQMVSALATRQVNVSQSDFREGELWRYDQIAYAGHYLFVEKPGGCFYEGTPEDLAPSLFSRRQANTVRGRRIARTALVAWRGIYRELATYHQDYAVRLEEIAQYLNEIELDELEGSDPYATRRGGRSANIFLDRFLSRSRRDQADIAYQRERIVPRTRTAVLDEVVPLPVVARPARFLDEDGSTRTEVYWGIAGADVSLPDGAPEAASGSVFHVSAVRYDRAYERLDQRRSRHRAQVSDVEGVGPSALVGSMALPGTRQEMYHLGLEWQQYVLGPDGSTGKHLRTAMVRLDSMRALPDDPRRLTLSDARLMVVVPQDDSTASTPLQRAVAYPFFTVPPHLEVVLYLEVYHLAFDADDRTRYTVAYEVEGQAPQGRWQRLLRAPDRQRTASSFVVEGSSRASEEFVMLDLQALRDDGADRHVRVRVRVEDEVTGQQAERTVEFALQGRAAEDDTTDGDTTEGDA